ncbi:3-isopropylmalate dehydrogenase [Mediterraneibacter glycyrrhizinilyticus]|uniref:3-isopropylmalate dehydrogenase n=1 Tax=Mediterraneibacter glycyrrhizinilyticus TaxID=342942 RepID=UPI0025AAEA20|nr:3-isopropylmalate dehydrogenase [Mediterraneibacter glycyrrhizinilyticus]MDN0060046.1 3-isopropylmalate dehydrogenase [Mediterraneibacter glycyrrhizinilyticus]
MEKTKLQWHPAFGAALRITLQDEMKYLEMHEEYLLSKKPLQMDVLIIKKLKDIPIRKAIGQIFRKHNIIEYKSPGDGLSINDFYKVYGYACIYQSDTNKVKEIDPEDLTLTFVCSHYPRDMIQHLERIRGIRTEFQGAGIYYLKGDPIPMQILIAPKLSDKENYWLQSMRTDLQAGEEIRKLMCEYEKHRKSKDYAAVMDLITRANWEQMEVEKKMCDALKELFAEELKEADSRGRSEGMRQGLSQGLQQGLTQGIQLTKRVLQLSAQGDSMEMIAGKCNVSLEQVKKILE